jgi:hypothetical protein
MASHDAEASREGRWHTPPERGHTMNDTADGRPRHQRPVPILGGLGLAITQEG